MTQTAALQKTTPAGGTNSLAKLNMRELKELAEIMVASGAFSDIKQVAQAQVKILAGAELGFSPIVSMTGIHFFQGKVSIGSTLMASLIKESGKYDYEIVENTDKACMIQFYRVSAAGERVPLGVPVRYTIDQAREAKLLTKDTWLKYPADMLFAACMRQGTRRYCADVLRGVTADTDTIGDEVAEAATVPETTIVNDEVVDTATGEIIDPPLDEAALAADPPIEVGETLEQITELIRVKIGDDETEVRKFLKGRDPSVMPLDALQRLLGDLQAL